MGKARWVLIAGIFITQIAFCAVLAWRGSQFAIITLAVTSTFLAVTLGFYGAMLAGALRNWGISLERWQRAQEWGIKKDEIMADTLRELNEYDEEAAVIQSGRSRDVNLEYLRVFREEDSSYIARAIREELDG